MAYNSTDFTNCRLLFPDGSNVCDKFESTNTLPSNATVYTYENITSCNIKNEFIYSEHINKNDIFKISDAESSFYCKNNDCVSMDKFYMNKMVELPDENGNKKLYIIKTPQYHKYTCIDNICVSYNCTSDSQCLYNKCVSNTCVISSNAAIDHCDTNYKKNLIGDIISYTYCGKAYQEPCEDDNDCSSKKCSLNKCYIQNISRSEFSRMTEYDDIIWIEAFFVLIIIIPVVCCCYCCVKKNKKNKKYNKF